MFTRDAAGMRVSASWVRRCQLYFACTMYLHVWGIRNFQSSHDVTLRHGWVMRKWAPGRRLGDGSHRPSTRILRLTESLSCVLSFGHLVTVFGCITCFCGNCAPCVGSFCVF